MDCGAVDAATTGANGAWSATATAHDPGMYVETLSVDGVPAAPLSFFVLATQPGEVMQNTSNPSISPNLVVGDTFTQTINAGPNAAYQPVTTVFNGTLYNLGQTDQNGALVLQGIGKDVGSYTITYVVGGIPATPPLSFTVASAGTVPSFTPLAPPVVIMELPNLSTTGACTSIAGTWNENTPPPDSLGLIVSTTAPARCAERLLLSRRSTGRAGHPALAARRGSAGAARGAAIRGATTPSSH